MKKRIHLLVTIISVFTVLCSCGQKETSSESPDNSSGAVGQSQSDVEIKEMDFSFSDKDLGNENISDTVQDISPRDTVTISQPGAYRLSGSYGQVTVDAPKTAKIQILLDNADINSSDGPAIYIKQADKVFLSLNGENTLSDSSVYSDSFDNADGVIFSKEDLTINGTGSLEINCSYKSAVVSKDDLIICGCKLNIQSLGTAIEGKDCIKTKDAEIAVTSGGDGLKSDNEEEENLGYIYVESSTFDVTASNDAFQSSSIIYIESGNFTLETGGGSSVLSSSPDSGWGSWGGWDSRQRPGQSSSQTQTESIESAKGIKAASLLKINGGQFNIDSSDDSLHSNSDMEINGGEFEITSGDDGIHADDDLIINSGDINITQSYEGIEATVITVSSGNISVVSQDDGLNAAGGNDGSGFSRPGANTFQSDSDAGIFINGGYIKIDASGDGVDSNGDLTVNGGVLLVSGPQDNGNGGLDYNGSAYINGGIAVITGSSGMAQNFGSESEQASLMYSCSQTTAGTAVALTSGDRVIASFTPDKQFDNIVISTPLLKEGEKYLLNIGGTVTGADENGFTDDGAIKDPQETYEVELTGTVTQIGGSGGTGGITGPGEPQGGRGGKMY